ncbi:DUF4373 domain-containing protein [Pedobacter sp. SYSU D00535]|uniref:DUF4373 domain-containing protein n=1 Tax=Pedobacter sp. SYSU D00535 TaxID=2810308 RepID=UPI001A95C110|nr:DUF4373 domain-containing protein [Pedobacter sp. SYSU D00535]
MARKDKAGISYYAMDVDHVHNKKIKLLVTEYDSHGYWIYQCLLAAIYQQKGYYFDLSDEDTLVLFAADVCKKPVSLVREVIECCVRRDLFSREIYENSRVLTSDRIQSHYLVATNESRKKGRVIRINTRYWLLENTEEERGVELFDGNSREIQTFSREKPEESRENGTQIKEKEIKENQIKGNETDAPFPFQELIEKILKNFGFNQIANFDKAREASAFLNCLALSSRVELFESQMQAYFEYKKISGGQNFIHSFKNFLGSHEKLFEDGAWNAENWIKKLETEKLKSNERPHSNTTNGFQTREERRQSVNELGSSARQVLRSIASKYNGGHTDEH